VPTTYRDLVVVMPVYNEEACIVDVVGAWRDELTALGMDFEILVLDDGSRDGTSLALSAHRDDPRITVISKPNSGHGPTILMGYRDAVAHSAWVFQCDSDNEMSPEDFSALWDRRTSCDALFGTRCNRVQSVGRSVISAVSRGVVHAFYSDGVDDVNTPYRLMRSELLAPIVELIPSDTFAPNLVISGAFGRSGRCVENIDIPHRNRTTGTVSIASWRLLRSSLRSLLQTIRISRAIRKLYRPATSPTANGAAR